MALHPHAPKGAHPSADPGWRGMLLNEDIQKLLLQAGSSQTPFTCSSTGLEPFVSFQLCPSYSVCVFWYAQQSEAAIHHANACKNMHSHLHPLEGALAGTGKPADLRISDLKGCSKSKNPTGTSLGDTPLFIPQLLPEDYHTRGRPRSFRISHTLPSVG